jgi:tetratricopeptide (TPR) repeat protein
MKYRVFLVLLLTIGISTAVLAQHNGFSSLRSTSGLGLSGQVLTPDGHGVHDARVEIRDVMTGSTMAAGYSLPNGSFSFNNVPPGQYEIVAVSGLHEAHERVSMDRMDQQVTLRVSDPGNQKGDGATISVAEMKIPDKARKEFEKAKEAFEKQKLDEARVHCAKSLATAPTYSRALTLNALLDLSDNKLEDAVAKAEQAVKSDYGYGMGYVVLGAIYNGMQRYQDAVRTLDRGIPLVPNSWQAHFEMAKALLGKGDFQRALASADRAIQAAPATYAPVHLVRAHVLLGLKSYQDAMVELERFIGADPNGSDTENARKTLDQVKTFVASSKK